MIVEDKYNLHYEINSEMSEFEYNNFDGNVVRSRKFNFVVMVPQEDHDSLA